MKYMHKIICTDNLNFAFTCLDHLSVKFVSTSQATGPCIREWMSCEYIIIFTQSFENIPSYFVAKENHHGFCIFVDNV